MSKNLEIEAKGKLTKDEYEKIINSFDKQRYQYQTNFYIDTPQFTLSDSKLGLRIRKEKDLLELTMKVPAEEGRIEINQKISPNEFENFLFNNVFPNGEIKRYLQIFYPKIAGDFFIFATLHNQRLIIELNDGEIAIDHFTYFDQEEYEIECESSSIKNAEKVLTEFLSKYKIKYIKNTSTKLERVINLIR